MADTNKRKPLSILNHIINNSAPKFGAPTSVSTKSGATKVILVPPSSQKFIILPSKYPDASLHIAKSIAPKFSLVPANKSVAKPSVSSFTESANAFGNLSSDSLSDDDFQPKTKKRCENNQQQKQEIKFKKSNCLKKPEDIAAVVEKFRQESTSNPAFQIIHDALPSLMLDYVVTSCNKINDEEWTGSIRADISSKEDANDWMNQFSQVSFCDFRVRKSKKENSDRLIFKKEYRCHHNTMPRPSGTTGKTKKRFISKHTGCSAKIRITIKQKSMTWSTDDLLQTFPCEIFIAFTHNHPIRAADVLRHRRPSPEVRQKFLKLFAEGHSPRTAIESHKFDMLLKHGDKYMLAAGDGHECPSNFWVYQLFYKESKSHYGSQTGDEMIEALRKFCDKYNQDVNEECCKVDVHEGRDLIVAVCTPLMKRTHTLLRSSGEMMFVDSSGTVDILNMRVFVFLTASVAGALPLGLLLVSSETEEVLKHGLDVWKSILPSGAFYGRGPQLGPKIAMTDYSTSERKALKFAFPQIKLLLCIFHVLQAFWRYVWKKEHNVPEKDRTEIFFLFKDLVYAPNQSIFEERVEDMKKNPRVISNPTTQKHILEFIERSPEWALFQRIDLLTRGHDTNNFSEATMRVLKDKILHRTKAFNPVQLLDFLLTRFISYIEMRITDVLNNRSLHPFRSRYFIDPQKLNGLVNEKLPYPPNCYKVRNTEKGTEYIVLIDHEVCSCPEGRNGKPCKHQCVVVRDFKLSSHQILPRFQTGEDIKVTLFVIVHGHRNIPHGWFHSLFDFVDGRHGDSSEQVCENKLANLTDLTSDPPDNVTDIPPNDAPFSNEDLLSTEEKMKMMFDGWLENLRQRLAEYLKPCMSMIENYNKISKSDAALTSAMIMFGKTMGPMYSRKGNMSKIPTQPTAFSRRKVYVEGRSAQTGGRPKKDMYKHVPEHNYGVLSVPRKPNQPNWTKLPLRKRSAAPHSLETCVLSNRSNGATHSKSRFVGLRSCDLPTY